MLNKLKQNWRENWLLCINRLTSFDLQIKMWLDQSGNNPHWSYSEFMCCYIDDLDIDDDYASAMQDKLITPDEFRLIRIWHEALRNYSNTIKDVYDHQAILEDPKWLGIVNLGLNQKIKLAEIVSVAERSYLMR